MKGPCIVPISEKAGQGGGGDVEVEVEVEDGTLRYPVSPAKKIDLDFEVVECE